MGLIGELDFIEEVSEHGVRSEEVLTITTEKNHILSHWIFLSPLRQFRLIKYLKLHLWPDKRVVRASLLNLSQKAILAIQLPLQIINLHFLPIRYGV